MGEKTTTLSIIGLAEFRAKYPLDEKVLIAPDGRQILETLARSGTPWLNFRALTIPSLAAAAIEEIIIKENYRTVSDAGISMIVHDIFTRLADSGKLQYFQKHAVNKGIIEALVGTINDLRMAGFQANTINLGSFVDKRKGEDIILILSEYEKYLEKNHYIDNPKTIALASNAMEAKQSASLIQYAILSRAHLYAIEKDFLLKLTGGKISIIEEAPVFGLAQPYPEVSNIFPQAKHFPDRQAKATPLIKNNSERLKWVFKSGDAPALGNDGSIKIFNAIGCHNEIKEILRRVVEEKTPVDDVEIICVDDDLYINEIYPLCQKLHVPVTFADGLPANVSSPARAVIGFLGWIRNDFAEVELRRLCEQGDLSYKVSDGPGISQLALLLRTSGIGWGRDRYLLVLDQNIVRCEEDLKKARLENEVDDADHLGNKIKAIQALKGLCTDILKLVPQQKEDGKIDFAVLCKGCEDFLEEYARVRNPHDPEWKVSAQDVLKIAGSIVSQETPFEEAIETLLYALSNIRVECSGPLPGHLHVANYRRGGKSGRNNIFIVGLDESKFPGTTCQDPILLDDERNKLGNELELSESKLKSNLYAMASLLADIQGTVTASYSAFDVKESRRIFPSSLVLQIFRIMTGKPDADYRQMLSVLKKPAGYSALSMDRPALDDTDWWIKHLIGTDDVMDGRKSVADIYPGIREGAAALEAREGISWTEYEGMVNPVDAELDPRHNKDMTISCSRIEMAAGCPFKYFMRYVLNVVDFDEVEKDVTQWLDALQKGKLLHEVFKVYGDKFKEGKVPAGETERIVYLENILSQRVKVFEEKIPPPNKVIFAKEYEDLKRDIRVFLEINEALGTAPEFLEISFGTDKQKPVAIDIGGGHYVSLKGIIDRIDKAPSGEYHVWDYKTGSSHNFNQNGFIKGAEQIQHVLYAGAAEQILGGQGKDKKAIVKVSGYLLPTEKGTKGGKSNIFGRDPSQTGKWQPALNKLMDIIGAGRFIMNDAANCKNCDYMPVCGSEGKGKNIKSKSGDIKLDWDALKDYE